MDRYSLLTLVSDFNQSPDRYSEQEAEIIRSLAEQLDMSVKQKSPEINLLDVLGLVAGGVGIGAAGRTAFKGARGLINRFIKRGKKTTTSGGGSSNTPYTGGADVDVDRRNNLLQLTSGTKNKSSKRLNPYSSDMDIEINRLEREAAMGDYNSWERLKDLYKYQSGYTGNVDYRRRFGFTDTILDQLNLPF